MTKPLRQRALADFYLASYAAENDSSSGTQFGTASGSGQGFGSSLSNKYSSSKKTLKTVIDIYEKNQEVGVEERTLSLVELGDWHMLFNRRNTAFEIYQTAHDSIATDPEHGALLNKIFGKPTALPISNIVEKAEFTTASEPKLEGYVLLNFNVSESGRARDVEITEIAPPENEKMGVRARRQISATRFRPRFENGVRTPTHDISYRFNYTYE